MGLMGTAIHGAESPQPRLVGQTLPVVRRYRERGEQLWVIELPDRSRQYVPASWCTPLASSSEDVAMADHLQSGTESPQPPLLSVAGLRELAALLRHLGERERTPGGEHDDGAAAEGPRGFSSTGAGETTPALLSGT
jgi:hypothetical protein